MQLNESLILFFVDIVLGYIPQAAGCAVCLFTIADQRLHSRPFLITTIIYAVIAMAIRLLYNIGFIDFGFHTIIIWMIFIIVAILYNKLPVMQSTVSILVSGILITVSEIITAIVLSAFLGAERFNAIMNNTATVQGQIEKAICGIPMNFLFLIIVLILSLVVKRQRAKKAALKAQSAEGEATQEEDADITEE